MTKPKQWEIWSANFAYEDLPTVSKPRPVLVIENKEFFPILTAKITSHPPRDEYPGEYVIQKWREIGLNAPSTIRLSKRVLLHEIDFNRKIGRLSPVDIIGVQNELQKFMR